MDKRADNLNQLQARVRMTGDNIATASRQALANAKNGLEEQIKKTKRYLGKLF